MAFSNIWDDTFPADTQLANLLGQDLRNFRVDTQERMAAISGLDAAKPVFSTDVQAIKWNGLLYFATDTGNIYQYTNPNWVSVTTSFVTAGVVKFKDQRVVIQTGDTAPHIVNSVGPIAPGVFGINTRVRIKIFFALSGALQAGANAPTINIGAGQCFSVNIVGNSQGIYEIEGGNFGATNAQTWASFVHFTGVDGFGVGNQTTAIDTTAAVTFTLKWTPANNSDQLKTYGMTVELL